MHWNKSQGVVALFASASLIEMMSSVCVTQPSKTLYLSFLEKFCEGRAKLHDSKMAAFSIILFLVAICSGFINGCKKNSDCPSGFCNGGSVWKSGRCAALVRPKIDGSLLFVLPIIILFLAFMTQVFMAQNVLRKRKIFYLEIYHFSLDLNEKGVRGG